MLNKLPKVLHRVRALQTQVFHQLPAMQQCMLQQHDVMGIVQTLHFNMQLPVELLEAWLLRHPAAAMPLPVLPACFPACRLTCPRTCQFTLSISTAPKAHHACDDCSRGALQRQHHQNNKTTSFCVIVTRYCIRLPSVNIIDGGPEEMTDYVLFCLMWKTRQTGCLHQCCTCCCSCAGSTACAW